jgi:hypothetical protein
MSLDIRRGQLRQQFVVQPEDGLCIIQHGLALGREIKPTALVNENGLAGEFFEALQLKGDGRLSPAQQPRGLRDASGLDDRNQRAEHPNIQADEVHFIARAIKARYFPCKFRAGAAGDPRWRATQWSVSEYSVRKCSQNRRWRSRSTVGRNQSIVSPPASGKTIDETNRFKLPDLILAQRLRRCRVRRPAKRSEAGRLEVWQLARPSPAAILRDASLARCCSGL